MSPAGLSWLQTLLGGVVGSLLVAAIIRVCVLCWRKCCINRDPEVVPSNADRSDASLYSRAEEGRSVLLHGHRRSDSSIQGPEGSPQTEQEQDEDSRQGEADGHPRTELAKDIVHSGHEFELQDLQGQNDIKPEGSLEEVQAPDGSLGTRLEQDGQSGQEVLPLAVHDEHSEGLRQRYWVAPRLRLRSWVATRWRLRYWLAPRPLASQLGH